MSNIIQKTAALLLIFVLSGCSSVSLEFLSPPSATSAPTDTPEPTVTRFPSPTSTRDPFALNTQPPTEAPATLPPGIRPSRTPAPSRTPRPTITLETLPPALNTPSPNLFSFVQRSTNQLVWGGSCAGDRSILFTATVNQVRRLKYVLLFYRLQDKYSARGTDWGGGAIMKDNDQGTYFYKLELEQIQDYDQFQDAWLQYQLVASTAGLTVLGRTVVDRTSVSVTHCSALP